MSHRSRLPNRRLSENFSFDCSGLKYTATVGRTTDGKIAELFLNNHKVGNQSDTNARDAAVVCSLALQYGVPLETIREALMRDANGKASGPLGTALDILKITESSCHA